MRILHLTPSLIAGSPYKLSRAQAKYGKPEISGTRVATVHTVGTYERDLDLEERKNPQALEELTSLLRDSDVWHFHNFGDEFSLEFGVDLLQWVDGKRVVMEYHSDPAFITSAAFYSQPANRAFQKAPWRVRRWDIPVFGATTRTARLYGATYFPNIIDIEEPRFDAPFQPIPATGPIRILHTSTDRVAKGTDGVESCLRELAANWPEIIKYTIAEGTSYDDCLQLRRAAHVSIGDMSGVYRTFHMAELEGLAFGNLVIADLDGECVRMLEEVAGLEASCPFLSVTQSDLHSLLERLLFDRGAMDQLRRRGYDFIRNSWHPKRLVSRMHAQYLEIPIYDVESRVAWAQAHHGESLSRRDALLLYAQYGGQERTDFMLAPQG